MWDFLAPFHPRIVHFPIALSVAGAVFAAAGLVWRQEHWFGYGQISLRLGWLGILAAGISGLIDQARAPLDAAVVTVIDLHITAGIVLGVAVGLAVYWPLRDKQLVTGSRARWGYMALLAVIVLLVLVEGWLGGRLVYDLGVGVK